MSSKPKHHLKPKQSWNNSASDWLAAAAAQNDCNQPRQSSRESTKVSKGGSLAPPHADLQSVVDSQREPTVAATEAKAHVQARKSMTKEVKFDMDRATEAAAILKHQKSIFAENSRRQHLRNQYKKALAANRMAQMLKENMAANEEKKHQKENLLAAMLRHRPIEDPLVRVQRKMVKENKEHFMLIHRRLTELRHYNLLCDLILTCSQTTVPVHSCLLAVHCEFWSGFCQERDFTVCRSVPAEIDFRHKVTEVGLLTVINYLYTGRIKVGCDNCVEVFDAARALKMSALINVTETFIKILLHNHNLWSTVCATKNTLTALFDIAWTKLSSRFVRLSKMPEFLEVELDDLIWILQSDELVITTEFQVFQAAMAWINRNRQARIIHFHAIMRVIRFAYMTTDELVECMKSDPIFQENEAIELLSSANLAKVFANQNQNWSAYDLPEARRPELQANLNAFFSPDPETKAAASVVADRLDAQVSTTTINLGALMDMKYREFRPCPLR